MYVHQKRETDLFLDTLGGPGGTVVRGEDRSPPLADPKFQQQQQNYQQGMMGSQTPRMTPRELQEYSKKLGQYILTPCSKKLGQYIFTPYSKKIGQYIFTAYSKKLGQYIFTPYSKKLGQYIFTPNNKKLGQSILTPSNKNTARN